MIDHRDAELSARDPPVTTSLVTKLLCPFKAVFGFFFFNSFVPTDTFIIKVRKVILGCMLIALIAYFVNIISFYDVLGNEKTPDDIRTYAIASIVTNVLPSVSIIVSFTYCRWTKTAPDTVIGSPCLTILSALLFFSFTSATNDLSSMISAVVAIVSMTAIRRFWYMVCVLVAFIAIVINCLILSKTTDWKFPGTIGMYDPTPLLAYVSNQMLIFILLAYFLYAVVSEFDRMIQRAQGAGSVSQELAAKLVCYDTDGAKELLKRCITSSTRDVPEGALVIDAQLLEAFQGIIHNLEQYRPHLPNYLLVASAGEDEEGEEGTNNDRSEGKLTERPVGSTRRSDSSSQRPVQDESLPSQRSQSEDRRHDHLEGAATDLFQRSGASMHSSKVTVAIVDLMVKTGNGDSSTKSAYDAVVATLNEMAIATFASLHSFVGDRVMATWNATKRVSKPEARACTFAIRLRDVFARNARVTYASMSATGTAESSFAGNQQLRLFVCSSSELWNRARGGLEATKHLHVAAIDASTRDQAAVDVTTRGIALLKATTSGPAKCLYELRHERPQEERDQEWMYVLERHADDPDEEVTQALHAYAVGRPAAGVEILNQLATRDTTVEALLAEMEDAACKS